MLLTANEFRVSARLLRSAHLNGHNAAQAKVRAPKLRGGRAGLFSTRTPYRPNPIGLSLVKLEEVVGDSLRLSGVDLVDGTPVLDVKPYLPTYDAPRNGPVRTGPMWVDPQPLEQVRFTSEAEAALEELHSVQGGGGGGGRGGGGGGGGGASASSARSSATSSPPERASKSRLTEDAAQWRRALEQTLAADPRPLYRWRREQRGEAGASAEYDVAVDGIVARCRFERGEVDGSECVSVLGLKRYTF